jgi:hypothetical protein
VPGTLGQAPASWSYRIAGRPLLSDVLIPELAAYASPDGVARSDGNPCPPGGLWPPGGRPLPDGVPSSLVYQGPGGIGEHTCDVECRSGPAGYDLAVDGAGRWRIAADGSAICYGGDVTQASQGEPGADPRLVTQTLLGPALILALALQDTWCLHASAISCQGGAILFVGPSGAGKSTLAARLPAVSGGRWRTLSDDVLPVALGATPGVPGPAVLPHFPQLKLAPGCQPAQGQPERLPLRAIYLLDAPAPSGAPVTVEPVAAGVAAIALLGQTLAGRLFDGRLLAAHLSLCTRLATCVPVRRLVYRREYDLLPHVGLAILHDRPELRPFPGAQANANVTATAVADSRRCRLGALCSRPTS